MRLSIAIGACTSIMAVYNAAKRMAGAMGTSWNVLKAIQQIKETEARDW